MIRAATGGDRRRQAPVGGGAEKEGKKRGGVKNDAPPFCWCEMTRAAGVVVRATRTVRSGEDTYRAALAHARRQCAPARGGGAGAAPK